MRSLILIVLVVTVLAAADQPTVLAVPAADRVVVRLAGVPVTLPLAHVEIPVAGAEAARARVQALAQGKPVEVRWTEAYGTDAAGTGKVHLKIGTSDVAVQLIEEGLAQVAAGAKPDATLDKLLATAQERAKKAKKGIWAAGPVVAAAAAPPAAATPPAATEPGVVVAKGAFAAELNAKYYYPAGHRAIANITPQRLIWYKDEAAAKKAGKTPAPSESPAVSGPADLATADRIYGEGEALYSQAITAGNSDKRDQLYEQAFVKLSEAMNLYGQLVEQDEENEVLAEKLRKCMQLRYGSVKQRRVH